MRESSKADKGVMPGVMRFLQMEWHGHERARNAWDIERAEMKAKIAKQEGETRSAKKLNESLDRQIRMLERALKAERAKSKALASGEKDLSVDGQAQKDVDLKTDPKGTYDTSRRRCEASLT
jgi:striatin 1/3/4